MPRSAARQIDDDRSSRRSRKERTFQIAAVTSPERKKAKERPRRCRGREGRGRRRTHLRRMRGFRFSRRQKDSRNILARNIPRSPCPRVEDDSAVIRDAVWRRVTPCRAIAVTTPMTPPRPPPHSPLPLPPPDSKFAHWKQQINPHRIHAGDTSPLLPLPPREMKAGRRIIE